MIRALLARAPRATLAGRGLVVGCMTLTTVALLTGRPGLYFLVSIAVAVAVLSFALPPVLVARLSVRRVLPRAIFAGQPFPVRVSLANGKRLLPALGLSVVDAGPRRAAREASSVYFPVIGPRSAAHGEFWARPRPRGVYPTDALAVSTSFPFGFGEKRLVFETPGRFYVFPAIGRVREGFLAEGDGDEHRATPRPSSGNVEFIDLRRYREGDNPRHIHWKVTARRGEPMVREFARRAAERRIVVLDTAVTKGGRIAPFLGRFERAVSLAATLCHRWSGPAHPLGLAIGGETPTFRSLAGRDPRGFLVPLAEVRPSRTATLVPLLAILPPTDLVLVVTARPSPDVEAELGGLRRGARVVRVLSTAEPIDRWFSLPETAS